MAVEVLINDLAQELRQEITSDLTIRLKPGFFNPNQDDILVYPYTVEGIFAYFPFYYANQKLKEFKNDKKKFSKRDLTFTGTLRDYQKDVVKKAIDQLNRFRTCFITMATGKGKTLTTIYLMTRLKVKCLVLLTRTTLFEQWIKSAKTNCPNFKYQEVNASEPLDPDCDMYLMNPINVLKRDRRDFADIGLLIADEADALCSEKVSKSYLHFSPKYAVALTATPERTDGLHKINDLHFGEEQIHIPLWVEHDYYKFNTKLIPEVRKNMRGHTDWHSLLEFQGQHQQRNGWIVQLCQFFPQRNILILCKRKDQTLKLFELLSDEKESVDYTTGTKKKFNTEARILVATFSKSGRGFDRPSTDMLILAADAEEQFAQYFGRCVRREDSKPILVDLVDEMKSLENHFRTRKNFSISVGGSIKDFRMTFPEFFSSKWVPRKEERAPPEIVFLD